MSAALEPVAEKTSRRSPLDTVLLTVGALLVVGILTTGASLVYSIVQVRDAEAAATPAGRVIEELQGMVELSPNNAPVRVRLAEALASAGRTSEAVRELNAALEIEPEHTGAYVVLGMIGLIEKDYEVAEFNLRKVIELTEGAEFENVLVHRELAFYYLGEVMLDTQRYEDAVGLFKATVRMNRANANAYFGLGMAFKGMEEWDAAVENVEIALAFDPSFAQAHYELGQLFMQRGEEMNAAVHFSKAAELAPENDVILEALAALGTPEEWETRARDALTRGEGQAALDAVLVARAFDYDEPERALLHGQILESMDKIDVALDVYRKALEITPEHQALKAALARLDDE